MASPSTEIVAWWGAILARIVFIWDIIKWRLAGPRLRLTVRSGMKSFNLPEYEGKTLIMADVVNCGDRPTTITHLCFVHYRTFWGRFRNRSETNLWIPNPGRVQLTFELNPGTSWTGVTIQTPELEKITSEGHLICAVYHTHTVRPVKARVIMK